METEGKKEKTIKLGKTIEKQMEHYVSWVKNSGRKGINASIAMMR